MKLTDGEKDELLCLLHWYIKQEHWAGDELAVTKLKKILNIINATPPKHTTCENCLDDLE